MLKSLFPCCLLIIFLAFSTSCESAEKTQEQTEETTSEMPTAQTEEGTKQSSGTSTNTMTDTELKMELYRLKSELYSKVQTIKASVKGGSTTDEAAVIKEINQIMAIANELESYSANLGNIQQNDWEDYSQKVQLKITEAQQMLNGN